MNIEIGFVGLLVAIFVSSAISAAISSLAWYRAGIRTGRQETPNATSATPETNGRRPTDSFPLSTAVDALVEADDVEQWTQELDAQAVRDCLVEAVEQIRWFRENAELNNGAVSYRGSPTVCAVWYRDASDQGRSNYVLCADEGTAMLVTADLIEGYPTTRVMSARGEPIGVQFDTGRTVALMDWTIFWRHQDRVVREAVYDREERRRAAAERTPVESMRLIRDPFNGVFCAPIRVSENAPAWLGVEVERRS